MTQIVPVGASSRWHSLSQAVVKRSYSRKSRNWSQLSSTASTTVRLGRISSCLSCRLYGGSAKIRSTESRGHARITRRQSPHTIESSGSEGVGIGMGVQVFRYSGVQVFRVDKG